MNFFKKYKWLLPMLAFTGVLEIVRVIMTAEPTFLFIAWNLFLAVIPLYFSDKLTTSKGKFAIACLVLWLLFFPNALYIVTDLFHLQERPGIPLWYDLLILFTAAMEGIILAFLSLRDVELYLCERIKMRYMPFVLLAIFMLSGYGIYLGRYLRWNSWDVVTDPLGLLHDVRQDVLHPFRNIQCWLLTSLFGTWMYLLYSYFKRLKGIGIS